VKTADEGGRKVFINMCGHAKVAAPGNWANGLPEEIQSALDNLDNLSQQQVSRQTSFVLHGLTDFLGARLISVGDRLHKFCPAIITS
jgi:hypothetical protein